MRTRVKICGITSVSDGLAAARHGADAIGLIFYPPSPRLVTLERACGGPCEESDDLKKAIARYKANGNRY